MSDVVIELNSDGIVELLKSKEMMKICESLANDSLKKLGKGYRVSKHTGKTRVNASVRAESMKARRENIENNTILKSLQRKT